jgi:hypothetical protein
LSAASSEPELQRSLKRILWQYENCLSCVWFVPNDPLNADLLERGKCTHSKLKPYNLLVSGRDWCNLYTEIRQKAIDIMQEKAAQKE